MKKRSGNMRRLSNSTRDHTEARFKRDLVLLKVRRGSDGNTVTMDEVPQKKGTVHNHHRLLSGAVRSIRIFGCDT